MAIFQHKYNKVCPAGVIIKFAIDALNGSRGRPVACVLMNVAEVTIFHHEVSSTNALPTDKVAVVTDPDSFWADGEGKLWLMTYPQLSEILAASPSHLEDDLSLLLHMGCGQYTWDIVKTCHDLWKWAWRWEVGLHKPIVWVYTISNLEESIYRDAPVSNLSTEGVEAPRVEWLQPEAFGDVLSIVQQEDAAHEKLVNSIQESQRESDSHEEPLKSVQKPQQLPEHKNRAVVFTSTSKLLEAYERHGCPPAEFVQLRGNMTQESLSEWAGVLQSQSSYDIKMLLVEADVGTIGTVRNLGRVLVLPVREGLFFDRRLSQVVWRKDIPMSKAEVRYAFRVACSPSDSGVSQVVSLFTTRAEFNEFPPAPTNPPAFTSDFPAVLLHFCEQAYFDGDKTSPIRLPKDEWMTNEYLRRLDIRGLTESWGGPLTNLGRTTAWWYHSGRIRNFDVANLLAIASTVQGARGSALMRIAAVVYHPASPLMSSIASFLKFQIPEGMSAEFHSLLSKKAEGFAQSYVGRGPIWIAVSIWAQQKECTNRKDLSQSEDFGMCDKMLHVSPQTLGVFENNWASMSQAWTEGLNGTQINENPPINEEDFLFLEECVVRVWMHNLVLVSTSDSGLGEFACDLASGSPITQQTGDPVNWAWLAEEVDSEPAEGEPYIGVFAVYTALTRSTGPDGGIQYVPEDLTFVSTRAVRRVLRDVAISKRREGYRLPNWHDLLRTCYPICCDPGES